MTDVKTLYIYTESGLHAGTGTGLGAVDLPIQREQTTGYPMIQGSGVKGALRSQSDADQRDKEVVFGPDNQQGNQPDFAGAAAFGDARILLFPVRALNGVFVWTTCESVLARFVRDCRPQNTPKIPSVREDSVLVSDMSIAKRQKMVLEEYIYNALQLQQDPLIQKAWGDWFAENALPTDGNNGVYESHYQDAMKKRLVILPDNDFRDFTLYATQVVTRVALSDSTKTVIAGPFTMELLPSDTLLYVPITSQDPRSTSPYFTEGKKAKDVLTWFDSRCFTSNSIPPRIQIGGDETVGYGRVALHWGV